MLPSAVVSDGAGTSSCTVVGNYFRIWNQGDPSHLAELLAPGWIDHARPEIHSAGEVADALTEAVRQPDMQVYVDAMLGEDPLITVNGRVRSGESTERLVWIVRVQDGHMREMWTYPAG